MPTTAVIFSIFINYILFSKLSINNNVVLWITRKTIFYETFYFMINEKLIQYKN